MILGMRTITIIGLVIISTNNFSLAQGFDASSLGMGGAYGAVARGVDALNWNPANLVLSRPHFFELNFVGANLRVGNSSLSVDSYERYLTESGHQGEWSDEDIEEILNLIPTDGFDVNLDLSANVLGMVFGQFGITLEVLGKGMGLVPKEIVELSLRGNLKDEYRFERGDADAFSAIKTSFAGAFPITLKRYFNELGVGFSLNYYRGLAMAELLDVEGVFYTGEEYIMSYMEVEGRKAEGGYGFSIDLGAAGVIRDKFTVGLALRNVLGSIKWNRNTEAVFLNFEVDSVKIDNLDDIESNSSDTTYAIDPFSTRLPFDFHLGVSYLLSEQVLLSLDLEQAFTKRLGYSDQGQLALGVQYSPITSIPLRAGMSFGGKWGYKLGLGFGLHFGFFNLDLAYSMHRALWPAYSKGISIAANIKFLI